MGGLTDFGLRDEPVDKSTHVLAPTGEVDALTAPELGRRLLGLAEEGKTKVVVDLSGVTFIDSSGIGVLLNALRHLKGRSGRLVLVCPTERILRPFQVTGLVGHLWVFNTREAALQRRFTGAEDPEVTHQAGDLEGAQDALRGADEHQAAAAALEVP